MELSLLFEDNNTGHKDLILNFAGQVWLCDSYYLVLDNKLLPDQEDVNKIRLVLRKLLEQWLSAVEIFADGNTVYLPYDFSDQYTAWLRCIRSDIVVEVCRGWAEKEGWAIAPSAIGEYLTQLPGFQPLGPTVLVSYNELLDAIRNMLK